MPSCLIQIGTGSGLKSLGIEGSNPSEGTTLKSTFDYLTCKSPHEPTGER